MDFCSTDAGFFLHLSLELFSQHACPYTSPVPNPGASLHRTTLSHLRHWPASLSTPAPPAEIGEDRTGLDRKEQHEAAGQAGGGITRQWWWKHSESGKSPVRHQALWPHLVWHYSHIMHHQSALVTESIDNISALFLSDQLFCVCEEAINLSVSTRL